MLSPRCLHSGLFVNNILSSLDKTTIFFFNCLHFKCVVSMYSSKIIFNPVFNIHIRRILAISSIWNFSKCEFFKKIGNFTMDYIITWFPKIWWLMSGYWLQFINYLSDSDFIPLYQVCMFFIFINIYSVVTWTKYLNVFLLLICYLH